MPQLFSLLLFLSIQLSSCKKCDTYCGTKKPLDNIAWLKELKETSTQKLGIYKATYSGKEGFFIKLCLDTNCKYTISTLRTCSNDILCEYGGAVGLNCRDTVYAASHSELIYSSY